MTHRTFGYFINYEIIGKNFHNLDDFCGSRFTLQEGIEEYIHDMIKDNDLPDSCELYDWDRSSFYLDHVVYQYEIICTEDSNIEDVLLSILRRRVGVVHTLFDGIQIKITNVEHEISPNIQ